MVSQCKVLPFILDFFVDHVNIINLGSFVKPNVVYSAGKEEVLMNVAFRSYFSMRIPCEDAAEMTGLHLHF
jgi:hypothetical protein